MLKMKYQFTIEADNAEELEQKIRDLKDPKGLQMAQAGKLIASCRGKLGSPKIQTIKAIREFLSIGLKEAKDFAEEHGGNDPWWKVEDYNNTVESYKRSLEAERKQNEELRIKIDELEEEIQEFKRPPYEDH